MYGWRFRSADLELPVAANLVDTAGLLVTAEVLVIAMEPQTLRNDYNRTRVRRVLFSQANCHICRACNEAVSCKQHCSARGIQINVLGALCDDAPVCATLPFSSAQAQPREYPWCDGPSSGTCCICMLPSAKPFTILDF
jgi:hypothetical protein